MKCVKAKKYLKDMPHLVKEYCFDKNVGVDFDKLTHGMRTKVWWICSRGHTWQAEVKDRHRGNGCPYCSNRKVCHDNCLATTHPHLLKEWDYNKNKLFPEDITYGSTEMAHWICSKGHCWINSPNSRTNQSSGCPYCSNKKVNKDNCLSTTHPELAKEWNYNKNKIKPTDMTAGSGKSVWWKCKVKHEWKALVASRKRGDGCPYCSNQKVCKDNCLAVTHPKLAKEWDYDKNKIKPEEITFGSNKKIWWKCKKGHEWESTPNNRSLQKKCPKCYKSRGEGIICSILNELKILNKREYKFKKLGNYKFDFALFKKYKKKPWAVIEYHGKQHYEVVNFSKNKQKNIEKFTRTKNNDKIKKRYCIDNDINYLEIPYWEKDIKKLIKDFLKKQGVNINEKTKTI